MSEIVYSSEISVEYVDHMGGDDRVVEVMLASSKGRDNVREMRSEAKTGRLRTLINRRHGTPFEGGCALCCRVHAPIKVWREWHRHRVGWSYNEESGRYKQLEPVFYLPGRERPLVEAEGFKGMSPTFRRATDEEYESIVAGLKSGYSFAYDSYEAMLAVKCDKGVARDVLGVGIYSTCYVTCNPRSLMHFLELRTEVEAAKRPSKPLYEIAMAATKMEEIFARHWPETHRLWCENGRMAP